MDSKSYRLTSTKIVIFFFFFFTGIEYSIILPTAWDNLKQYGAQTYFLGLVISFFYVGGLIGSPIFGMWSDCRPHQIKVIFVTANMFEIIGSLLYIIGMNKFVILASRILSGFGSGAVAVVFSYITRATPVDQRTSAISVVMGIRQAGMVIGPGLYLGLQYVDFWIGSLKINKLNCAGFISSIFWVLINLMVCFMFYDLPRNEGPTALVEVGPADSCAANKVVVHVIPTEDIRYCSEDSSKEAEVYLIKGNQGKGFPRDLILAAGPLNQFKDTFLQRASVENDTDGGKVKDRRDERKYALENPKSKLDGIRTEELSVKLLDEDQSVKQKKQSFRSLKPTIIVVLIVQFATLFNYMSMEAVVTPVAQRLFDFQAFENSLLYFSGGLETVIGFIVVKNLSACISDRTLLIVGLAISTAGMLWGVVFFTGAVQHTESLSFFFVLGMFLILLAVPFLVVAENSLYSKLTPLERQGFYQAIFRNVGSVAAIAGPTISTAVVHNLYVVFAIALVFILLCFVLVVLVYARLADSFTRQKNLLSQH